MEEVARAVGVTRPTLYAWFDSKEELFRAATEQALIRDLNACEQTMADRSRRLPTRVLNAFDRWAGQYVGPLAHELRSVIESTPELLSPVASAAPARFQELVTRAITETAGRERAREVAQTLISASIGIKHQVDTRQAYRRRMAIAVDLLLP